MLTFPGPLLPATFLRRENRFRAAVRLDEGEVAAHVPNSGRLAELLIPGARCYVTSSPAPGRTSHVLRLVEYGGTLVSIDARLPNGLLADAWQRNGLGQPFSDYCALRSELMRGDSRLDFLFTGPAGRLWVEVKSVTLVGDPQRGIADGLARFPDAPTARGARHLRALMDAVRAGDQAAVVFVVQRADALGFTVHEAADPAFAATLREACAAGVQVHAYRCDVSLDGIALSQPIPVLPGK